MTTHLIAIFVTVEQETAIRQLFSEKGWLYVAKVIVMDQETCTPNKITVTVPQNIINTSEMGKVQKFDSSVISVQNPTLLLSHSEAEAVKDEKEEEDELITDTTVDEERETDCVDEVDIVDKNQGLEASQTKVQSSTDDMNTESDTESYVLDHVGKDVIAINEDLEQKSDIFDKQPKAYKSKRKDNKITLEEFKKLVKAWPMKVDTEPSYFPQNVSYGTWLKPIDKPYDLDNNFFSKSKNGYFCCNCSLLFKNLSSFIKHRTKTDGKCYYECGVCNKKYCRESDMHIHQKYHSDVKSHVCEFCSAAFKKKDKLNIHIQQHHKSDTAYICNICQKAFKAQPSLYAHMRTVHVTEEEKLLCTFCPQTFKTRASLKNHMISQHSDSSWPCENCGKTFKTVFLLRRHVKRHTHERKFSCTKCSKSFYSLHHLKNHTIIHSGLKPYECDICEYKCNVKCNLDKHMKLHKKEVTAVPTQTLLF